MRLPAAVVEGGRRREPTEAPTTVAEPGGFSGVSIVLVIAVVAIIVAGLWLYRQRD